MKKGFLFVCIALLFLMGNAQTNTYRQNINQEIRQLKVTGGCIVHLQLDTCNWVAYKGALPPESKQLVIVENNTLTTTEAANGKTLYVGTSAGKDTNLMFEVSDNAIVLYDNQYYMDCQVSTRTAEVDDQPERDWTGLGKYGAEKRLLWDFFFGSATWAVGGQSFGSSTYPTSIGGWLSHTGFQTGYSLYMDDHIAAGIGIGYTLHNNQFKKPYIDYLANDNALIPVSSTLPGKWTTTATTLSIGVPLHFIFYPNKQKHYFNMRLELIPQLAVIQELQQDYTYEENGVTTDTRHTRDMNFNLFNLTTRLSINFGVIGAYAEIGLTPLGRDLDFMGTAIAPRNASFGLRINLFELL